MEIRKSSSIWLRHTKIIPQTTWVYRWLCIPGPVQSGAEALVKTEPPTLTSHLPCDSRFTAAAFDTAWICLLANFAVKKCCSWLVGPAGGVQRKRRWYGRPAGLTSLILIATGCFVSLAWSGSDAAAGEFGIDATWIFSSC